MFSQNEQILAKANKACHVKALKSQECQLFRLT